MTAAAVVVRASGRGRPTDLSHPLRAIASRPAPNLLGLLARHWQRSDGGITGQYLFTDEAAAHRFLDATQVDDAVRQLAAVLANGPDFGDVEPVPAAATIERPVFVISAPRTGSTLLYETLAAAGDLWTVGGESHGLIEGIPALHPGVRDFASHRLTAGQASADVTAALRLGVTAALRDCRGRRWLDLPVGERPERPRWLEKTPENALRLPFLRAAFPGANFVVLVRDPDDTIASLERAWRDDGFVNLVNVAGIPVRGWSFLLPDGWRSLSGAPLHEVASTQYAAAYEAILAGVLGLPRERWAVCTYEQLVRAPERTLRGVAEHLDITVPPGRLSTAVARLGVSTTALRGPSRGSARWTDAQPAGEGRSAETELRVRDVARRLAALTPDGSASPMPATTGARPFHQGLPAESATTLRVPLPTTGPVPWLVDPIVAVGVHVQLGTAPLDVRRRARFRERFADGPIVWREDTVTGLLCPWSVPLAATFVANRMCAGGTSPVASHEPWFDSFARAGILTDRATAAREQDESTARLARAAEQFTQAGVSVLANVLPDAFRVALSDYYARMMRAGGWALGDEQVQQRYGWHNETVARFVHHQLRRTIEMIVQMPIKPSYCYVSAYRSKARLAPHVDREQCEITVSMLLDRDSPPSTRWPLVVETDRGPVETVLEPGHAVVFLGCEYPHYRLGTAGALAETVLLMHYVRKQFERTLY